MMDQETESGVDFSFDLLKYVNGDIADDEDCLLWNDNGTPGGGSGGGGHSGSSGMRYSQPETMLDPALITGIVLSPTSATSSSSTIGIIKNGFATASVTNTNPTNEQHNPWGEER